MIIMGALSDRQFHDLVLSEGGASRDSRTRQQAPKTGAFVSTPFHERQVPVSEFTPALVGAHRREVAKRGGYQGGWHPTEPADAPVYMDHSRRTKSTGLAVGLGIAYNQESIYAPNHRLADKHGYVYMGSPQAEQIINETRPLVRGGMN